MKTETKKVYLCEHCNKLYQIKSYCEKHEDMCKKNPENIRPCHNCKFIDKVKETVWAGYGDRWGNEAEREVNVLFCEKIDCFIYPPSVAHKGNAIEMENKENIEMPKSCEFHEKLY